MTAASPRAFTLIELLVVIAIIGILSSVVLASLNSARSKGTDSAIKSEMSTLRSQAQVAYETIGGAYTTAGEYSCVGTGCLTYSFANTLFGDTTIMRAITHIADLNKAGASSNIFMDVRKDTYVIAVALGTAGKYWCIDNRGTSRGTTASGVEYTGLNVSTTSATYGGLACN